MISMGIPLLYYSNSKALTVDERRSYTQTDIAPMILDQLVDLKSTIWSRPNDKKYSYHQQGYHYAIVYNNMEECFKLWYNQKSDTYQLFDLNTDPKEVRDLYHVDKNQSMGRELKNQLRRQFELID